MLSHRDTVCAPLGHGGCTSGTPLVYQWDLVGVPVGHGGCTSGTRWVYQWDTVVPQWDTVGVPAGHGGCTSGTRWVYQWDTVGVPVGTRSAIEKARRAKLFYTCRFAAA